MLLNFLIFFMEKFDMSNLFNFFLIISFNLNYFNYNNFKYIIKISYLIILYFTTFF